ncbi:AAA family ATPase [Corallococcus sp. AS-1-6]|uniref:AAA family ATPase n=1 Tax=Corallococcus sp. AS-1-6 TaxID=2874599 RepID=UPI001CBD91B5|nr:AAA family ATPase [Corallococcus sp. AS-1-6]MBZ4375063.1 AAA family ATPase [Corallococcus sp. AS-1-6]
MLKSHGMRPLLELSAKNYKSLRAVTVRLGPLNVLVGPNGSGKTNLLDLIQFLGDSVREDLGPALDKRGGLEQVCFRGRDAASPPFGPRIRIHVKANVTTHSHEDAPDEYVLNISSVGGKRVRTREGSGTQPRYIVRRSEQFTFKRVKGRGRRITINGSKVDLSETRGEKITTKSGPSLRSDSLGLSTLPRLAASSGGDEVRKVAELFSTFRVFDVDTRAARLPSPVNSAPTLQADASNLAAFLNYLSQDEERFERLQEDARAIVPGLVRIHFRKVAGAEEAVAVELEESGLRGHTSLAEASFGTVRALALLALLYDPQPPMLTCVEEIDHGFHPYVFDRLVERLRMASERTQLLIATHSPSLVNRLSADELIVCERDTATGASIIPAADPEDVRAMEERADGRMGLGELWFTGSLGGVPR